MAKQAPPPVKLRTSRRRKPRAAPRVLRPVRDEGVPLEDVLVAFEKSLARATRHSVETSRAEVGFGLGERAVYVVDALNLQLKVGLRAARGPEGKMSHILVDFGDQQPDAQSTVDFRVQARPLEAFKGSQLILANMDSLGHLQPQYRLRGTLLLQPQAVAERAARSAAMDTPSAAAAAPDETLRTPEGPVERVLQPQADLDIEVRIIGGDTHKLDRFLAATNAVGQFDFTINAADNTVMCGNKQGKLANVDLKEKDDDFFVFALYNPGDGGEQIVSNIIHLDVKRELR